MRCVALTRDAAFHTGATFYCYCHASLTRDRRQGQANCFACTFISAAEYKKSCEEEKCSSGCVNLFFFSPYVAMFGGVRRILGLWTPHAELALVGGTVHHSGGSENCLHQQQHHQDQQQDVVRLLERAHTHTLRGQSRYLEDTWRDQDQTGSTRLAPLTFAVGTSCRKISTKLMTLQERKPEAEKSKGDVTLLMAITTST